MHVRANAIVPYGSLVPRQIRLCFLVPNVKGKPGPPLEGSLGRHVFAAYTIELTVVLLAKGGWHQGRYGRPDSLCFSVSCTNNGAAHT